MACCDGTFGTSVALGVAALSKQSAVVGAPLSVCVMESAVSTYVVSPPTRSVRDAKHMPEEEGYIQTARNSSGRSWTSLTT